MGAGLLAWLTRIVTDTKIVLSAPATHLCHRSSSYAKLSPSCFSNPGLRIFHRPFSKKRWRGYTGGRYYTGPRLKIPIRWDNGHLVAFFLLPPSFPPLQTTTWESLICFCFFLFNRVSTVFIIRPLLLPSLRINQ